MNHTHDITLDINRTSAYLRDAGLAVEDAEITVSGHLDMLTGHVRAASDLLNNNNHRTRFRIEAFDNGIAVATWDHYGRRYAHVRPIIPAAMPWGPAHWNSG
jgi:hypothetical protein